MKLQYTEISMALRYVKYLSAFLFTPPFYPKQSHFLRYLTLEILDN